MNEYSPTEIITLIILYLKEEFFLKNSPADFSRILHDYSNDKKGFIIWKGNLEERLV